MNAKYLKSGLLIAAVATLFTACETDRDDNPVLDTNNLPASFVLNTPAYAQQLTDLSTSSKVNFTWNQPDYGMTLPVVYSFQLSVDDTWTDAVVDENGEVVTPATYSDLSGSFTTVSGGVKAVAVNNAIMELKGWDAETVLPASMDVYVRCKATLLDSRVPAVYSNSVKLLVVPATPSSSYDEFVYAIGDDSSWSTVHKMRSAVDENDLFTGEYCGFAYLNTAFKFRSHEDSWDAPDWGYKEDGVLKEQAGDIAVPAPGFYMMEMSLADLTYKLTPVTSISIIGTVNGNWDTATDMTYNTTDGCWEVEATLKAGAMKFRMNHQWTYSWGGANDDSKAYDNLSYNDGKDLDLDADGTYLIQLYIETETCNKVVITKK